MGRGGQVSQPQHRQVSFQAHVSIRSVDPDTKLFFRGRNCSHSNDNEEDYLCRRVHCDLMCGRVDGVEDKQKLGIGNCGSDYPCWFMSKVRYN